MNSHRNQISARNSAELAERTRATGRLNLDEGTPMPEYVLRNLDPVLWSRFTERANREGWPIKALIVELLEAYADGVAAPQKAAPKQLPEWAWLREYYNAAAKAHG